MYFRCLNGKEIHELSYPPPHLNHTPAPLLQRDFQPEENVYDPWSITHNTNPYATYARLRQEEPIFFSSRAHIWVVSRYEDVTAILKDHQRFAAIFLSGGAHKYTPEVLPLMSSSPLAGTPSLPTCDPPVHTRLRASITRAMSAQRIAHLESRLRQIANRLIDTFEQERPTDFMARFAHPYPLLALGSLLEIPEADLPRLQQWMDDLVTFLFADIAAEQQLALMESYRALEQYFCDVVEQRQQNLRDDFISELLKPGEAGQAPLSIREAADLVYRLFGGALELTAAFLGNCLLQLLSEPQQWQMLVNKPDCIPAIIEELLRFNSPSLSTFRRAKQAVELGGQSIPEGAIVQVLMTSANHDEAVFAGAETFQPERGKTRPHVAFGYGIHYCIGAPLERLQIRVALEQMSQRFPSLHLVPGQQISYLPNLVVHGVQHLFIEW